MNTRDAILQMVVALRWVVRLGPREDVVFRWNVQDGVFQEKVGDAWEDAVWIGDDDQEWKVHPEPYPPEEKKPEPCLLFETDVPSGAWPGDLAARQDDASRDLRIAGWCMECGSHDIAPLAGADQKVEIVGFPKKPGPLGLLELKQEETE